jgi:glycosyltransferase involved in cell wall biosynthesis
MQNPFFSVIVTNYNHGSLIGEALSSAIAQTYSDFEIIVADNCSMDESWDVICSFNDPRIRRFRHYKNLGMYTNLNFAVSKSCGTYLKFLNSDDILHPQCLERLWLVITDCGTQAADFPIHLTHGLLQAGGASMKWKSENLVVNPEYEELDFATGGLPNCCVNRQHFIAAGLFGHSNARRDFSKDILAFGLSAIGVKKIYIPQQLVLERVHCNQSRHFLMPAKRFQLEEILFLYAESGRLESGAGKAELNQLLLRHFLSSLKYLFLRRDPGYLFFVLGFAVRNSIILVAFAK